MMRSIAIALFTPLLGLLSATGAQAGTTQGRPVDPMAASAQPPSPVVRLAGSFQNSTGKLGDKYMTGQAGGRYGTGGTERKAKGGKSKSKPKGESGTSQDRKPPAAKQQQ